MYRTHTNGELRISHVGQQVTLSGWVQRVSNHGGMTFIGLRDRYGITQLYFDESINQQLFDEAKKLGREYVLQAKGAVRERSSKNSKIATGDIEIVVENLKILNKSEVPPFTIEDETDGGEEIRMKYRYLDLRRAPLLRGLELRHRIGLATRTYLDSLGFIDVETPFLINSTPEGARDFVVPSRVHNGKFYALPQSPQVFKQLLMVAGYDRYYQIVRCFRDEDLRADRQPEFTQIDCEMAFVEQEDILNTFEGLTRHLFQTIKDVRFESFPRMDYYDAMNNYGSDKPDLRFGMKFQELTDLMKNKGFKLFDEAEYIGGICAESCASYTRKDIDTLTEFVKRSQIGATALIYIRLGDDGIKSSVDKFFNAEELEQIAAKFGAKKGDLILILAGKKGKMLKALCELRLEMGTRLGLRDKNKFAPLWVIDFPLFEWNEEDQRFYSTHHPFTSPKMEDVPYLTTDIGRVRSNSYDLVINGNEIAGGSIRIHDSQLQHQIFGLLGFTPEQAEHKFGFLMNAFKFGAPPHGGIAFGFDRLTAIFYGVDSIRDVIAFPKNNAATDTMIEAPSIISPEQLKELSISVV